MSLTTLSKFYYGHTVTDANNKINFKEGVPELTATLNIGSYTLTDYAAEVKRALDAAGALTYTVSVARSTRVLTVSAGSNFSLLTTSGSNASITAFTMMGFSGADKTGASTYSGAAGSGSVFTPQFILQDHISSDDWQQSVDAVVNKSASGQIEVVRFGVESFVQFKIRYATNIAQPSAGPITNSSTGLTDLRTFMQYIITKAPIEYMADKDTPTTWQDLILESNPDSQTGTGYKHKELYDRGMPGYFETPILKMRVV